MMLGSRLQREHYRDLVLSRRPTRSLFSCGWEERFDPFLLDNRPELARFYRELADLLFTRGDERVLDVGCGTGLYYPVFAPRVASIVGIDISPEMLEAGKGMLNSKGIRNVELRLGSAEEPGPVGGPFDLVMGLDVVHHVEDVPRMVSALHPLLASSGRLALLEPNIWNPLMFAAHLIPREERLALLRHRRSRAFRHIASRFRLESTVYLNHITSRQPGWLARPIQAFFQTLEATPLKVLSLRFLVIWRKV
ncbi:MAG: methyltransferase domain-containing protein [Deltaproteobacteria bacterium]|nr:methyltransferase domain-containing protein [Deltaproteobacteria bacterium]